MRRAVGLVFPTVGRPVVAKDHVPGRIDDARGPGARRAQQFSGRRAKPLVALQGRDQGRHVAGLERGVVIQEQDVFAGRGAQRDIVGGGEAEVARVADEPDILSVLEQLDRSVDRAVVDHDGLDRPVVLGGQRIEALVEEPAPIPVDDDGRHQAGCQRGPPLNRRRIFPAARRTGLRQQAARSRCESRGASRSRAPEGRVR